MLRQLESSRSQPPTIGPSAIAAPVVAPQSPIARARSCRSVNTCVSSDSVAGKTIAAPTPITARAPISWSGVCISPPTKLATPKTARPARSIPLRPNRSERLTKTITDAANSREIRISGLRVIFLPRVLVDNRNHRDKKLKHREEDRVYMLELFQ